MSTLGERLRIARERKGLKQIQVKEHTGINNKTLSGYENGVSEPDIQTLTILARLYDVSADWLTGIIDESAKRDRPQLSRHSVEKTFGTAPDQNPLGIELSPEQLDFLREISEDPNTIFMFKDLANSTPEDRRMLLDIWQSIKRRGKDGK